MFKSRATKIKEAQAKANKAIVNHIEATKPYDKMERYADLEWAAQVRKESAAKYFIYR